MSNEELRGSTPEAAAQVVQWVSFADSDIVPPASTWVFPTLGIMHHNKQVSLGTWGGAGLSAPELSDPVEVVSVKSGQREDVCCREVTPDDSGAVRPDDL